MRDRNSTADSADSSEDNGTTPKLEQRSGLLVSRRSALVGGAIGLAAVAGVSEVDPDIALAANPTLTQTEPLPTTTAPEQLRLAWGADPATEVTVSWSAPGSVQMPAPTLAYSTSAITVANPGAVVTLPAPAAFSLGAPRTGPVATSFVDGLSQEETFHYHVPLSGLAPNTKYYYQVSDGASTPATETGSFTTAPTGRAAYRFTAFGDIGTPTTGNPSGYTWTESSDTSIVTVNGLVNPGDGKGPGLFHLMLADLSYANVNPANMPLIWRDYQYNASRASSNQPWMPIQGNHEVEYGVTNEAGGPSASATDIYNGPYGSGNYLARHLLPDNGLTNHDGNSLQGSFYSFQVGTVLFVCLNTNDVVYQNPQTVSTSGSKSYAGTYNGGTLAAGAGVGQFRSTGGFVADPTNLQLVPDVQSGTPNLQTQWLETQLQSARAEGSSVDVIVVCEHHCALSTGPSNGVDLAIRAAWLPLYDEYQVDLVIGGHDHDYERSYPVRGYDATPQGKAVTSYTDEFGNVYATGAPVNTRRPTVVTTEPTTLTNGMEAWNTGTGTVFLQIGGGGAAGGVNPVPDPDGLRPAVIWGKNMGYGGTTTVAAKQTATEEATWSATYDTSDTYGYAVFDVDPGTGPGETKLTYQWWQAAAVSNINNPPAPLYKLYEEFVFTRMMPAGQATITDSSGAVTANSGDTLLATAGGFVTGASFAYQWLRGGNPISGATNASYTAVAADAGQALTVAVTATAQSYPATTVTSAAFNVAPASVPSPPSTPSSPTVPSTPTNAAPKDLGLTAPGITGTPRVGQTLGVALGAIVSGASVLYQWMRDGVYIDAATEPTYQLVPADAGQLIQVRLIESANGYSTASVISPGVTATGEAFTKTPAPTIHGTVAVGHVLTAEVPAWSPAAAFSYAWLLNGKAIPHATHKTLKVVEAYVGKELTVRVTGTRSGYSVHTTTSARVAVKRGVLKARTPRISGKAVVDATLHAHIGEWPAGTQFSYRWFANGWLVPGETGHTLRVAPELRGKRIVVEVTGQLTGHESVSAQSAATPRVRRLWTLI